MLSTARQRGFRPRAILFDSWYASTDNLKRVWNRGWTFVTRWKANRLVRLEHGPTIAVGEQPITVAGVVVWPPGFGSRRMFRIVAPNRDTTHGAINDLGMDEMTRRMFAELSWSIEE